MSLTPGKRLGPYEILSALGAGGMGEVYRARDTRLDRTVAIKILPEHLSSNLEAKQRFEREARAISALQHPNICTLHDVGSQDGVDFLVMEYLQGETLAERLKKGPLPLDQVIKYGAEIAQGLEKAHRSGVVHRDLKPGNIMLTKTGAKLMDFGLAKGAGIASVSSTGLTATAASPSVPVTAEGLVVGTFQYMSPEQVEGKEADARSDIFALGAVLYEMATGKKAFEGKTAASAMAAVLEREPGPISALQPKAPPTLEHVVRRALAKDPDERWQSAKDLANELKWIAESGASAQIPAESVLARAQAFGRKREVVAWACAAIALVLAGGLALDYFARRNQPDRPMHFSMSLPSAARDLAISPDGRILAFVAPLPNESGIMLWVSEVGSAGGRALEGTEDASYPFWSPDNRFIGFFADGKLKKIAAAGGPVQVLCDAAAGRGGTWNRDDVIVFCPAAAGDLYRVSAAGGAAAQVTHTHHLATANPRWPVFLPDGSHFLYTWVDFSLSRESEVNAIYVGALGSDEKKRLVSSNSNSGYVDPGYIAFMRGDTLMAQQVDADRLELRGEAIAVANNVRYLTQVARGIFSVSQDGKLVYATGAAPQNSQLVWFDRRGKQLGQVGASASYANPRISPDGKKVAVDITDPESFNADIWILDLARGVGSRFTFDPAQDEGPLWSPKGERQLWYSDRSRGKGTAMFEKATSSTGTDEAVPGPDVPSHSGTDDWSHDGKYVIYSEFGTSGRATLWVLPMAGGGKVQPFLQSEYAETQGQFSPDGRWVAYCSNESGKWQVYVTPFPGRGGKFQVSTGGGQQPRWRRDGKELFFLSPDRKLMAVPVKLGDTFEAGSPVELFQTRAREPISAEELFTYDVSADGQRFLVNSDVPTKSPPPVEIVLNWTAELRK